MVTAALTHGIFVAGYLFVDDKEEVILPDLFWDNYELVFCEAYGATLKHYETFTNSGFNLQALGQSIENGPVGKKVVLLNFPNNPAGYTVTEDEANEVCRLLTKAAQAGNQLVVILDDAYFGLVTELMIFTFDTPGKLID